MIGTKLAHYEITAHLGTGGMGEVYQATDSKLGRSVAIKLLPEAFTHDTERVARFEREARVLASLNHPNIAAIYGVEESGERKFLVMELAPGDTLADRIRRGPVPLDEALHIAHQIAAALESAHEKGVVHRDLKPANIKVIPDGVVKVLDFGLAKAYEMEPSKSVTLSNSPTITRAATQQGVILGTAAYMSPEQARGKSVDKRSDIWSFGVVLYEMLTGKLLFEGEDVTDTLAKVLQSEPKLDAVPIKIRRLLKSCLERDPKNRLRDIADAWRLLDESAPTAGASRSPFSWAVAVVSLIIAAALGFVLWRVSQPVEQPLVRLEVELGADVSLPIPNASRNAVILSPNGTRLAYVSGTPPKLFIRRLDQPKATSLPGTEETRAAFFSPDGRWVGFVAAGGDKLNKISVEGGAVVPLANSQFLAGGVWGEDGNIYIGQASIDGKNPAIVRIPAGGGLPEKIMDPTTNQTVHDSAQILPGGKALLFSSYVTSDPEASSVQVITLTDHKIKTIVPGARAKYLPSGHLIYSSKGTLFAVPFDVDRLEMHGTPTPILDDLAYSRQTLAADFDISSTPNGHGTLVYLSGGPMGRGRSGAAQALTLQWIDATGKKTPLISTPAAYRNPRLSPDGKKLAVIANPGENSLGNVSSYGDVWVYDLVRETPAQLTKGEPYTNPIWTPDGKYLIAGRAKGGMVWMRADGSSQPQTLLSNQGFRLQAPNSITSDGKWLAYSDAQGPVSTVGLWTVPLSEDAGQLKAGKPDLFLEKTDNGFLYAAFSPDSQWLAYTAFDGSGIGGGKFSSPPSPDVYVRPFPPSREGGQVKISDRGVGPVWSKNGELLYLRAPDIMAVRYIARGGVFEASKPRVWRENATSTSFDVDPDGKRLVILVPADTPQPTQTEAPKPQHTVTYMLNFFDEVKRRAPIGK
jgi:serine/threonine-protein kinase